VRFFTKIDRFSDDVILPVKNLGDDARIAIFLDDLNVISNCNRVGASKHLLAELTT
jgi:hypothetical protein